MYAVTDRNREDQLARKVYAVEFGRAVLVNDSTDGSRQGLWATPRAGKTTDENPETWKLRQEKGDVATMPLTAQVHVAEKENWRTPDTSDRRSSKSTQIGLSNQISGKLNPRWVETLMGVPVGWTMPSCVSPVTIERMS
jgi:hypothetical protein